MKDRTILIVILLLILGIYAFGYWLYTQYQATKQQVNQSLIGQLFGI